MIFGGFLQFLLPQRSIQRSRSSVYIDSWGLSWKSDRYGAGSSFSSNHSHAISADSDLDLGQAPRRSGAESRDSVRISRTSIRPLKTMFTA